MNSRIFAVVTVAAALAAIPPVGAHEFTGKVKGQVDTISSYLSSHPEMVIDFTSKSGEYCLNTWKVGGSHMTHYAVDPSKTSEDVIDFVKTSSLEGVIDVSKLPLAPTELGAMKPNQWYFLPAGQFDPHHGKPAKVDLVVRATNIE